MEFRANLKKLAEDIRDKGPYDLFKAFLKSFMSMGGTAARRWHPQF